MADARKIGTCKSKKSSRPVDGYGGRARRAPEEAHLTNNGVRRDAPHAHIFTVWFSNIDRKTAAGDEIDSTGRISLAIKDL